MSKELAPIGRVVDDPKHKKSGHSLADMMKTFFRPDSEKQIDDSTYSELIGNQYQLYSKLEKLTEPRNLKKSDSN